MRHQQVLTPPFFPFPFPLLQATSPATAPTSRPATTAASRATSVPSARRRPAAETAGRQATLLGSAVTSRHAKTVTRLDTSVTRYEKPKRNLVAMPEIVVKSKQIRSNQTVRGFDPVIPRLRFSFLPFYFSRSAPSWPVVRRGWYQRRRATTAARWAT